MPIRSSTLGHDTTSGQHFQNVSNTFVNVAGIIMSIVGQVGQNVGLPIWLASAPTGTLDSYFVLLYTCVLFAIVFFIGSVVQYFLGHFTIEGLFRTYLRREFLKEYFLVGFFTALNGLFLVFAAPPDRCPAFLQSALSNTMIPLVIFFRIFILQKVPNRIQSLCALGVVAGLFLTSIPSVFDLDPSSSQKSEASGPWKVLWPLIFAFSFLPAAIFTVLQEKYLNKELSDSEIVLRASVRSHHSSSLEQDEMISPPSYGRPKKSTLYDSDNPVPMSVFLTLVTSFQTCVFVFLFWYDLLPTVGYAHDMNSLLSNFWNGLRYTFMQGGASAMCLIGNWMFVIFYCMTSYGQGVLLRYSEGAIYSSMVNAAVTPIGEIFWMLFDSATDFRWNPTWTSTSYYPMLGLVVIVPCVFAYNVYGGGEAGKDESVDSTHRSGGGSLQYSSKQDGLLTGITEEGLNGIGANDSLVPANGRVVGVSRDFSMRGRDDSMTRSLDTPRRE